MLFRSKHEIEEELERAEHESREKMEKAEHQKREDAERREDEERKVRHERKHNTAMVPDYCVGVMYFTGENIDRDIKKDLTDVIAETIDEEKGNKYVINLRRHLKRKPNANKILTGSVEKAGDGFIVSAQLDDAATSELIISFSETAATEDDIKPIAEKIGRGIIDKLK